MQVGSGTSYTKIDSSGIEVRVGNDYGYINEMGISRDRKVGSETYVDEFLFPQTNASRVMVGSVNGRTANYMGDISLTPDVKLFTNAAPLISGINGNELIVIQWASGSSSLPVKFTMSEADEGKKIKISNKIGNPIPVASSVTYLTKNVEIGSGIIPIKHTVSQGQWAEGVVMKNPITSSIYILVLATGTI